MKLLESNFSETANAGTANTNMHRVAGQSSRIRIHSENIIQDVKKELDLSFPEADLGLLQHPGWSAL